MGSRGWGWGRAGRSPSGPTRASFGPLRPWETVHPRPLCLSRPRASRGRPAAIRQRRRCALRKDVDTGCVLHDQPPGDSLRTNPSSQAPEKSQPEATRGASCHMGRGGRGAPLSWGAPGRTEGWVQPGLTAAGLPLSWLQAPPRDAALSHESLSPGLAGDSSPEKVSL